MPSKITSAGDSKFRVINKPYNGGDCWINISKDLKPLFNFSKGDLFKIRIYKKDFIKAINVISILSFGDLWECPSKELKRFRFSDEWFKDAYNQIAQKFDYNDYAFYDAKYGAYSQDRSYIQNNDSVLNIRDFLIEKHSLLTVEKLADGILDMHIDTSVHDLSALYVNNIIEDKDYDINELAEILRIQYTNAPDREKVLSIHMFGIKYGKFILENNNITIPKIIQLSGLPESYAVEVNKGVNIYLSIKDNKYGVMFGDSIVETDGRDNCIDRQLQLIFYGAPGTGKSHSIKDNAKVKEADQKKLVFRTTFHPDSDYSTFVGAYKPTMKQVPNQYKAVVGKDEEIAYEFIPQAFLQAYIAAWNNQEENVFLVIEEINRGNCAQIFGDLFQLLDRDDDGYSEYPIKADKDLAKYLNGKDEKGIDVLANKDGIIDGDLKLPKNLYIWATMNTSDQSLFPIDSAFKRRWEWVYMPIMDHKDKDYKILIDGTTYDWWGFLEKINSVINTVTNSEDKKLGYFFVKTDKTIDAKKFVGKVLFYLWNDVFKNYGFDNPIFNKEDKTKYAFSDFFKKDGSPETESIKRFLKNLDETIDKENPFTEKKPEEATSTSGNNVPDLFANQE